MQTAVQHTETTGLVFAGSRNHIWRGDGTASVCGRWTIDQLDPDAPVPDREILPCQVCTEHASRFV